MIETPCLRQVITAAEVLRAGPLHPTAELLQLLPPRPKPWSPECPLGSRRGWRPGRPQPWSRSGRPSSGRTLNLSACRPPDFAEGLLGLSTSLREKNPPVRATTCYGVPTDVVPACDSGAEPSARVGDSQARSPSSATRTCSRGDRRKPPCAMAKHRGVEVELWRDGADPCVLVRDRRRI